MEIITKEFNNFNVRILIIDGKEWFIAKDIAELLQYKDTDQAIRQHCKNAKSFPVNLTGQVRNTKLIQELDVWRLIIKSRLPEAEKIERWIFEEVLPSIRKTGKYELSENSQEIQDVKSYIQKNSELIDLIKIITSENPMTLFYLDKLTQKLNIKSPVDLLEIDLNSYYFIPTELGKFLNKSAVEVNKILEKKGFQEKIDGVWTLTEIGKDYAIQLDNHFSTIKWKLESLV